MQCFHDSDTLDLLDRDAFKFTHKLMDHPALSLEGLSEAIPAMPKNRVMYSLGKLKNGDDFESTFKTRPVERSIEETIETIRVSNSYVMVAGPEIHPAFQSLHRELIADVESLMRRLGVGREAIDPQLFLFIASPDSITPFHIDRYSTFLMQFRGSKEITVFPQWDDRVVASANRDAYVAYSNTRLPWQEETNALGSKFEFHPGEALHIPFIAGHHVRNGSSDVSISMSIIFNTAQSMAWRRAMTYNHFSRRVLGRIGIKPSPVGQHAWRDGAKSSVWGAVSGLKQALK
ncbi:MAG: cupin-like domain-containing protein [Luteibacter sp.]